MSAVSIKAKALGSKLRRVFPDTSFYRQFEGEFKEQMEMMVLLEQADSPDYQIYEVRFKKDKVECEIKATRSLGAFIPQLLEERYSASHPALYKEIEDLIDSNQLEAIAFH